MITSGIFRQGNNFWAHAIENDWLAERNLLLISRNQERIVSCEDGKAPRSLKGFVYRNLVSRASIHVMEKVTAICKKQHGKYISVRMTSEQNRYHFTTHCFNSAKAYIIDLKTLRQPEAMQTKCEMTKQSLKRQFQMLKNDGITKQNIEQVLAEVFPCNPNNGMKVKWQMMLVVCFYKRITHILLQVSTTCSTQLFLAILKVRLKVCVVVLKNNKFK